MSKHISEWRSVELNGRRYVVHAYSICTTEVVVIEALESGDWGSHTTTCTDPDGARLGRIGSRVLPASLDALPAYSRERIIAVREWREAQHDEAQAVIDAAFPNVVGQRLGGELETSVGGYERNAQKQEA